MATSAKNTQATDQSGLIDEIIRLSDYNFERLPMLEIIGDRFVESISVALPELTQVICEASMVQMDYVPLAQIIDTLPDPAMIAICSASEIDGEFMMIYDSTLLLTFVELALGGNSKLGLDSKPEIFTAIERGFGAQLTRVLLAELQSSMAVLGEQRFSLESMELDPEAANIAPQASLCVRIKLSIAMAGQTGALQLAIPYDGLEHVRHKLAKVHYGDSSAHDRGWQEIMAEQVVRANTQLEVVLAEVQMTLGDLMSFSSGDIIEIGADDQSAVIVTCEQAPIFLATTGHKNNGIAAVQITELLEIE